ncbi:hypothetical protein DUNSADRAFT_4401, partial [Dunaliella salina]
EAEAAEKAIFRQREALKPLTSDPVLRNRLGIQALVIQLSDLLIRCIKEQLPKTLQQVKERLELVEADLKCLPPAIDRSKRAALITRTLRDLSLLLDPNIIHKQPQPDEMKQLHQGLRASRKTFAQEVLTRRPIFRDPSGGLLDYKEDWEPPLPAGATSSAMTETQVQEIVGRNRTSELPTEVPTSARVEIIAAFMNTWEGLAYSFLRDRATAFGHALLQLISVQPLLRDCPELCSEFSKSKALAYMKLWAPDPAGSTADVMADVMAIHK